MTLSEIQDQKLILLDVISGSTAYGLALPHSDIDKKGVFFLPFERLLGLSYVSQVSDESNDITYYELGRTFELLGKNNPTLLKLLATPPDCVLTKHPLMEALKPEDFLSKLCLHTFAGYASAQIRKARGLNKKIMNPVESERKTILEFCYVLKGQGSVSMVMWLQEKGFHQEDCGLVNIPHMKDVYALFHEPGAGFQGIMQNENANEVLLSSVPEGMTPAAWISFNQDGYTKYCKDFREYWDWVEKRNDERYENSMSHGKNYDAKNMMHTFRLLDMAAEIAQFGEIRVRRDDRDFYLNIRAGEYAYEELMKMATRRLSEISDLYDASPLPYRPDLVKIEKMLVEIRKELYR